MIGRLFDALEPHGATLAIAVAGLAAALLLTQPAATVVATGAFLLLAYRLARQSPVVPSPMQEEDPPANATPSGLQNQISALDLAAAVPDPLVIFEPSSAIAYANHAARDAFGILDDGMSLLLKFRSPEMQELIGLILTSQSGHFTGDYAQRVPVEAVYRVTGGRVGSDVNLFFLLFKDQSESRRIDRMRSDFIANASHELRTPLASISGFVETLLGPARDDPAARERFLKIMQEQTGRMSRLIDDLLSLSRLEMKSHTRPSTAVDLREVIGRVADSLRPLARELSVEINVELPAGPLVIQAHADELFQVFENLIENACKYGQSGGKVDVSVTQNDSRSEIRVSVRDYGPGIAEEHIPRITERFYRVDVQSSRARKGTGLGLAIVKHILTRHNARLTVNSKLGEGSEFVVELPVSSVQR